MKTLQRERRDAIEIVRLDRPEVRNAMSTALLEELIAVLGELAADEELRALVLSTTSEKALSAGADVGEELDAAGGIARMELFTEVYAALDAFPAPSVAVCVGNCVGAGAELAAGCDLRVAGDNLKLAWAGGRLGVPVGPARLVPLIGLSRAKELILTGRVVGGEEAERVGLAHRVAAAAEAEAAAVELAEQASQGPIAAMRGLKGMFRDFEHSAERVALENALLLEFQRHGAGLPRRG
ncbi:MAG: enoyl-CoA hydratase/isomerase family protein [Solirubrobacteraceae bacterium]